MERIRWRGKKRDLTVGGTGWRTAGEHERPIPPCGDLIELSSYLEMFQRAQKVPECDVTGSEHNGANQGKHREHSAPRGRYGLLTVTYL